MRFFLLRLAVTCLLLALAACAGRAAPNPRGPDAPLSVAVPAGNLAAALEGAAAEYARGGGEPVEVIALDASQYNDQVSAALLAGLDRYDLVYLPQDALGKWIGYQTLRPFEGIDPGGLEAWLPALSVGQMLYGLPVQPDVVVIWYRADLLAAAGMAPPRTWAEFQQAAEQLGAAAAGSDLDAAADFAAVLASFGGQALEEGAGGYRVALESAPAAEALAFYADPVLAGRRTQDGEMLTRADVLRDLREGRAALGIAPLSAADGLRDCQAAPLACRDGVPQLAWTWLPNLDPSTASGSLSAWAMPLKAARPQAAQRFAAWLAGAEGGRAWARNGGVPAHRAALAGEDAPPEWLALSRVERLILPVPALSTAPELWRAYHSTVHAAASGAQTPAEALAAGARQMRRSLRMGGY